MSLDNLYAPVQQGTPGLVPDYSPITDAITAIYQRRAQMQMHADQMARDAAKMKQDDQLARDRLAEEARYHTAEMGNMTEQRRLQKAQIDAAQAKADQLEQEKLAANQGGFMKDLGETWRGRQGGDLANPALQALVARGASMGIGAQQVDVEHPRPDGAEGPDSAPGQFDPPTQALKFSGQNPGTNFVADPLAEIQRRQAMAKQAAGEQTALGQNLGGDIGKGYVATAPQLADLISKGYSQEEANKAIREPVDKNAQIVSAGRNAAAMRISVETGKGTTEDRLMGNQILTAIDRTVKESKLPELADRVNGFREALSAVKSKSGGLTDEAMIRKLGLLYNKGSFSDKDAAAMDPTGKLGLMERIKASLGGPVDGVRMTPAIRAQFERTLAQLEYDANVSAHSIYEKKFLPAYIENPDYSAYQNLVKSQAKANFGSFDWFNDSAVKYAPAKVGKPAAGGEKRKASISTKGGATADEIDVAYHGG